MDFSNFPIIQDEIDCLRRSIMPEKKNETRKQTLERTMYNADITMKLSKLIREQEKRRIRPPLLYGNGVSAWDAYVSKVEQKYFRG